jgi:predicted Fe-Mo cluster-binding NifX family protein
VKIAIPSNEEGILYPHFGHAPAFAVLEVDESTKQIIETKLTVPEMGGHAAVPPWLNSLGVSVLIAGGLGAAAIENLNHHNIDVYYGASELPVQEVVTQWLAGNLKLDPRPCSHQHGHDCGHGDHQHG